MILHHKSTSLLLLRLFGDDQSIEFKVVTSKMQKSWNRDALTRFSKTHKQTDRSR